jgi:hypothetical protein
MKVRSFLATFTLSIFCLPLLTGSGSLGPESAGSFDAAALGGMIYDSGSRPLQGAAVTVDDSLETVSDLNGRFLTPPITPGVHLLEIRKTGYETKRVSIEFSSRLEVLYVSLVAFRELLADAEARLDADDLPAAESLLARAALIQEDDPALLMLTVALGRETGESSKARRAAQRLVLLGFDGGSYPELQGFLE